MTDILIAFIFGAFVGASLLVAVSCMIVRGDCDKAYEWGWEDLMTEISNARPVVKGET